MSKFKVTKTDVLRVSVFPDVDDDCYPENDDFYVNDLKAAAAIMANYPAPISSVSVQVIKVASYEVADEEVDVGTDAGC